MDSTTLDQILTYLTEELGGDWLLTGGALVRLSFDANRGTEDIDLVGIRHASHSDSSAKNELFKWLIQRGLGPEWVNSAVEPFVREVADWENETLELRTGGKGRILRPSLTLFVYLKLRRGTAVDLEDIRKAIPHCSEGFDEKKLNRWASSALLKKFQSTRAALGI